ncbi:helicase HerA-like domain-containing protein [Pararoseomonas sp. SCSIO 73927]|uniref:helicase HerA-like domain-containing protein n=1 Tax=Pararoseomonas sp. SCSIO 73927 TaxID=3114537 RepID=UPI0030D4E7D2
MADAIPEGALESSLAIVGRSGSGKSYAARGAAERLLDLGRQLVVLDPTGVWWGLRAAADGKKRGFSVVILGGDHGDLPLPHTAGDALARQVVQGSLSLVLDTSGFTMGQRRVFYAAFLERLYADNRQVLHLVVDEADELAPQNPQPDQTVVLHRLDQIVRRGRVKGFRVMLITQRPAVLNKNVLSQAGALLALKLPSPQDRKAIAGWIEGQADRAEAKALIDSLPSLPVGEGWVWWPEGDRAPRRVRFPRIRTFDSGRTPAPGEAAPAARVSGAELDLSGLRAALQAAEEVPKPSPSRPDLTAAAASRQVQDLEARVRELQAIVDWQEATLDGLRRLLAQPVPAPALISPPAPAPAPRGARKPGTHAPDAPPADGSLRRPALRLLEVLASRHPARITEPQWAALAGLRRSGGNWRNLVSQLRVAGVLTEEGRTFGVSSAGFALLPGGGPPRPKAPTEIRAMWARALGGTAARMMEALLKAGAAGLTRLGLAEATGIEISGGNFRNNLSKLRTAELLVEEADSLWLVKELRDA